jgi:hypothetical protein
MPSTATSNIHILNLLGLLGFVILWLGLVECSKILIKAVRNDPLIGWAVGPLGITTLFLCEPSARFILFSTLLPTLISGGILYLGLFTSLPSPLLLPHTTLVILPVLASGILITGLGDWLNALRDLRYPLWGEARILHSIQNLRASWASIHFTSFGLSYLREHFGSNPTELLRAL